MKNSKINLKFLTAFMLLFFSIITFASKNSTVIKTFENKFPQDKFYFIQGLDYKFDLSTSIRYRGILYSNRLEKMGYPFGLELALEGSSDGSEYLENYESLFLKIEVDKPIEKKMKEIFGKKSVLNNNYWVSPKGYKEMLEIIGKRVPFEEKGGAYSTIVNVFVDRLEDINKEDMKQKTYKFARYLYDEINLTTYLQVYIRDNTFFENYNLAAYQVYPPFRERENIKKILEKIKSGKKITENEKITLTNVFYKNFAFNMRNTDININFKREPLKKYKDQKIKGRLLWEDYIDEGVN